MLKLSKSIFAGMLSAALLAAGGCASRERPEDGASAWEEMFPEGLWERRGEGFELSPRPWAEWKGKTVVVLHDATRFSPARALKVLLAEFSMEKVARDIVVVVVSDDVSYEEWGAGNADFPPRESRAAWFFLRPGTLMPPRLSRPRLGRHPPVLVVYSVDGEVVTIDGREDLMNNYPRVDELWRRQ